MGRCVDMLCSSTCVYAVHLTPQWSRAVLAEHQMHTNGISSCYIVPYVLLPALSYVLVVRGVPCSPAQDSSTTQQALF